MLTSHKKLDQLQAIVEAIEAVYNILDPAKQKLIQLRYWTRPQTLTGMGLQKSVCEPPYCAELAR
ncbi:hypothetical protein [Brevibacillus laterosporus]|uniref:hypothetical protein n=1 Tax=Brevibacillus laterosporus TaxID=1465 RepID=UPI001F09EC2A|nr:hypothetical protein [Brevibacillus laterosporus]